MASCVRRRPRKHHLQLFTVALLQAPLSVHTKGGRFNQVRLNTSESEWVLRTVMLLRHIVILSAVCTALYHCLLTELPHICTANSVLLMKQARKRLLTVPVNFSGYLRSSSLRLRGSYSVERPPAGIQLQFPRSPVGQRLLCCLRKPVCISHARQSSLKHAGLAINHVFQGIFVPKSLRYIWIGPGSRGQSPKHVSEISALTLSVPSSILSTPILDERKQGKKDGRVSNSVALIHKYE